ncbi:MAG TPA: LPS assembly protein LptD [Rhizomicrobium sp.]|jgi:LPS-assembly protein|nr:LPS assembly protein LptD [Rhizomicrobium sp.]
MSRALKLALLSGMIALSPFAADGQMNSNAILGKGNGEMLVKADRVTYDTDTEVVTAQGHVEIDYNGRIVTADTVTYDDNKDVATADGHVVMMAPNGDVAFSNHAVLTDQMRDGVLNAFAALIGKTGRFTAATAVRTKDGTVTTAHRALFSPCKICNKPGQRTPLWAVKAERAVYDQPAHKITYTNAVLQFFGVPVGWTPFFSTGDGTEKHVTGILAPDIGTSSVLGSFIRVPVYIAFNDSQDLTIAPLISTRGGELLEGEYRQRWADGGMWLQASVANNPHGGLSGNQDQTYSSLFGSGIIPMDSVWHFGYDAQITSNDTYLKRYNISDDQRLTSDIFLEGIDGRSRFEITGYFFQGLLATDVPSTIPIVAPLVQYTFMPENDVLGGEFRFDFNTAAVTRDFGVDSQRATAQVKWSRQFVTGDGEVWTIRADLRGDAYRTTNSDAVDFPNIPERANYVERGLPDVGLDWRWPFISGGGSGNSSLLIEPIVQAIAAPYGDNPAGIPDEDSSGAELNELDIFSFDPLPGYDVVETGPRANFGLHAEAFFPTGSADLLIGQTFRLKPDPQFAPDTGLSGKSSDMVERFSLNFLPHLSFTQRVDFDPDTGTVRRDEVYMDASYGRSSLEVSYLRLPPSAVIPGEDSREEINAQGTLGLWEHYVVYAEARRDLAASQMIDTEFGFGYEDECLGASISWRRQYTRDRDVPPSSSVLLRIHLKTDQNSAETGETGDIFPKHIFSSTTL